MSAAPWEATQFFTRGERWTSPRHAARSWAPPFYHIRRGRTPVDTPLFARRKELDVDLPPPTSRPSGLLVHFRLHFRSAPTISQQKGGTCPLGLTCAHVANAQCTMCVRGPRESVSDLNLRYCTVVCSHSVGAVCVRAWEQHASRVQPRGRGATRINRTSVRDGASGTLPRWCVARLACRLVAH